MFPYVVIFEDLVIDMYASLDIHSNEVRNFSIEVVDTRPASPAKGRIIFYLPDSTFEGWDGTVWKILS